MRRCAHIWRGTLRGRGGLGGRVSVVDAHLTPAFGHPSPRCGEGSVSGVRLGCRGSVNRTNAGATGCALTAFRAMDWRDTEVCVRLVGLFEDAEGGAGDLRTQAREAFGVDAGTDRFACCFVEGDVGEGVGAAPDQVQFYYFFQGFGHGLFADAEQVAHHFVSQRGGRGGDEIGEAAAGAGEREELLGADARFVHVVSVHVAEPFARW